MTHQIAYRGDTGLFLASWHSYGNPETLSTAKNCKDMAFNHTGSKLAWSDGKTICIQDPKGQKSSIFLEAGRTQFMFWSPKDTYLATWEVLAIQDNGQKVSNLKIWDVSSGQIKASFFSRKSDGWQPRWSQDEEIVAVKTPNNEVAFYKGNQFDIPDKRLNVAKMDSFSLSSNGKNVVVVVLPGKSGGVPGFAKMFTFPAFNPKKDVIAHCVIENASKVDAKWSGDSKSCLLLIQNETEETSDNYGESAELHLMDVHGVTSMVELEKDGPIYSVDWAPNKSQFIVVYGFMPSRATLFNKKCEPVFDFGSDADRNTALFNTQGTLMLLGGLGENLGQEGTIEIWDIGGKKSVATFAAPNTTEVKWSPDGQHIFTATCAPKLKSSNGFKIWHYTSTLLHETKFKDYQFVTNSSAPGQELWEVAWKPDVEIRKSQFKILNKPIFGGIKPTQPSKLQEEMDGAENLSSKSAMKKRKKQRKNAKNRREDQDEKADNSRNETLNLPTINETSGTDDEDELPEHMREQEYQEEDGAENLLSKSSTKNKKQQRKATRKMKEEENSDNSTSSSMSFEFIDEIEEFEFVENMKTEGEDGVENLLSKSARKNRKKQRKAAKKMKQEE